VDQGSNSFWAVWVDYLETGAVTPPSNGAPAGGSKKKVDYKERLSPEDFDVYLQLRTLRKDLAAEDGVALYAVFTNEQLAQAVERRVRSKSDLQQIAGIGEARADKYGPRIFALLNEVWNASHETDGKIAGKDRRAGQPAAGVSPRVEGQA
jgi:hypothetical protein